MSRHSRFVIGLALLLTVLTPSISPVIAQDAAKATVYVYRQKKFGGSGLSPSVFVDDKKVADMDNGRYFALKLEPGTHVVRSNEKDSEIDQAWEAGKVYFVKINIATGFLKGHGQIAPVSEKQARNEMEKLKPLDAEDVEESARAMVVLGPLK
jgi:hypothetical protein